MSSDSIFDPSHNLIHRIRRVALMCSPTPHSTRRFSGRRESVSPKLHFDAFSRCCKSHRPVPPVSRPTKVVSDQLSKVQGGRSCLHVIAPPPMGKRSIVVNVSVCLFVCPRSYLRNYTSDLHCIFRTLTLWPWLSPPLAVKSSVTYFRFYG